MITALTDLNFNEVLRELRGPMLVTVWREGCRPCEALTRAVIALSRETPDVRFAQINSSANPLSMQKYEISVCPQMLIFKDGQMVARWKGAIPKEQVQRWLARNV